MSPSEMLSTLATFTKKSTHHAGELLLGHLLYSGVGAVCAAVYALMISGPVASLAVTLLAMATWLLARALLRLDRARHSLSPSGTLEAKMTCELDATTFTSLLSVANRPVDPHRVHDLLLQLNRQVDSMDKSGGVHSVEYLGYCDECSGLRIQHASNWSSGVSERVYPIPGHTPGGGSSIAGRAMATGLPQASSDDFCRFCDSAEHARGCTASVFAVPIIDHDTRMPVGALAITSTSVMNPSNNVLALLTTYALALSHMQPAA